MEAPTTGTHARSSIRANTTNAAVYVSLPPFPPPTSESALDRLDLPEDVVGTFVENRPRSNLCGSCHSWPLLEADDAPSLAKTSIQADGCTGDLETPECRTEKWKIEEFAKGPQQHAEGRIRKVTYDLLVFDPRYYPFLQKLGTAVKDMKERLQSLDPDCILPTLPEFTAYILPEKKEATKRVNKCVLLVESEDGHEVNFRRGSDETVQNFPTSRRHPSVDSKSNPETYAANDEADNFRSFIHSWCVDVDDEPTSAKLDFQSVKETNGSGRSCAAENKDKKFVFADENMTGREVDLSATEVDLSETEVDLSETEVEPREAKRDPSEGKGECNEAEVETDIETPCYDLDRSLRTGCQQTAATSRSARAVGSFDPHLEEQQEQTPCHRLEVSDSDKENQSRAGVARKRGSDVLDSDQGGKRRKVRDDASFGNAIDLTEDL